MSAMMLLENIHFKMLIVNFLIIFAYYYVQAENIPKILHGLLTKNSTKLWLKNQTIPINKKNPYCSICCVDINQFYKGRKCGIHTMCTYEKKKIGSACRGLIIMEFSQNEIDAIVDIHNTLRNRIALGLEENGNPGPQPSAANMRLILWDKELALVALRWASQCVFLPDRCRDLDRFPVGQNLAKGTYASKSDLEHILDWYQPQVEFSNREILEKFIKNNSDLASFTQIIWADTYLIGCARVSFQNSENGQIIYKEHFICNYGPAGNIPYQAVYKIGETCSACSEGTYCTNSDYPGLCSNELLNNDEINLLKNRRKKQFNQKENHGSSIEFLMSNVLLLFVIKLLLMSLQ